MMSRTPYVTEAEPPWGSAQSEQTAVSVPGIAYLINEAIGRAVSIRDVLRDHHSSLIGATPQDVEKAGPAPSNSLASLQALNSMLADIQKSLDHTGSFL